MYKHLENMIYLYGEDISVQVPNGIFKDLSSNIKSKNNTNIQQSSFAYAYLILTAFLYKYSHYVDIDNGTYIQNADIKELLGYNRITKTIDHIIKKDGVLDQLGLTSTTRDYPVRFITHPIEKINNIPLREFVTISELNDNDVNYSMIKEVVKNRNYTIKEPTFLFEYQDGNGTLYDFSNTHKVTMKEVMRFITDDKLNNIDFAIYCFLKSKCYNLKNNTSQIGLNIIVSQLGIGKDAFYSHLGTIKENKFVEVNHKGWVMGKTLDSLEANEYCFKGI